MASRRTVIEQLASAGEDALEQLAQNPVTRRALDTAVLVKDRLERLLTGLSDIDGRLTRLEKRVAALEKPKPRRTATRRPSAAASKTPPAAASKPEALTEADPKEASV
jgi:hypothetical protein